MLPTVRRLLAFEMTIAEWIGAGVLLGVPYVVLGTIWAAVNSDRFEALHGFQLVVALVSAVLSWPVLMVPAVCPG